MRTKIGVGFYFLLIEPVWNRNVVAILRGRKVGETFNRTSMESKLFILDDLRIGGETFNRTSMESKQLFVKDFCEN